MDERDQYMNKQENTEQSRVLWIILSALTVLAIVVGAGIFFFFPSSNGEGGQPLLSAMNSEEQGRDYDPTEYVRNDDGYPQMVEPETTEEAYAVDSTTEESGEIAEVVDNLQAVVEDEKNA